MYILVLLIVDSNWQLVIIQHAVGTVVFRCIDWFSALTLLFGWQEGHPACKNCYLSGMSCRLAYVPADATATHCLCFDKIQIGFTFLVQGHPGSPGKRAVKRACVSLIQFSSFTWFSVTANLIMNNTGLNGITWKLCVLAYKILCFTRRRIINCFSV